MTPLESCDQQDPDWSTCQVEDDCIGVQFNDTQDQGCLNHTTDDEARQRWWTEIRQGAPLDARGLTFTGEQLGQLLEAAPRNEQERPQLTEANFSGATFRGNARFSEATFVSDAVFDGATFAGDARFAGATFAGNARFDGATFAGDAVFAGATFAGHAGFDGATFAGDAVFAGATFAGNARFAGATFESYAVFDGATFAGNAGFAGATFESYAVFDGATFESYAVFDGATFAGNAAFDGATFAGDARFTGATFAGDARFTGATFAGNAAFDGATFAGHAGFDGATFAGNAGFAGATFAGNAGFAGATFESYAVFARATFAGHAGFDGATFESYALFVGATFASYAGFDGATFAGDAAFTGATFADNAVFDEATFAGHAGFAGATFTGKARLGPIVVGDRISLEGATFLERLDLEVAAARVDCNRTRLSGGGHLRVGWAHVDVTEAEIPEPCILEDGADRLRQQDHLWERLGAQPLPAQLSWTVDLRSLQRATVTGLVLGVVDLRECRFHGAHGLDRVRVPHTAQLHHAPPPAAFRRRQAALRPVAARRQRRRVLAEEITWRQAQRVRLRWAHRDWQSLRTAGASDPAAAHAEVLEATDVAELYRALRAGREARGDEPGAADFYYGEMEMRRKSASASWAERRILDAYWLLSGYALRASRALVAFLLVVFLGWGKR